jgi:hypothetical protein
MDKNHTESADFLDEDDVFQETLLGVQHWSGISEPPSPQASSILIKKGLNVSF